MTATITVLAEKGSPLSHTEMDNNFRALRNLVEVPTVAALRALGDGAIPNGDGAALTQGCLAAGDGGGGVWRWDAASSDADNIGTVVLPTGHVGAGRWIRVYDGPLNVMWFGAYADGTHATETATAIQAAIDQSVYFNRGDVYIPAGTYAIDRTLHVGYGYSYNSTLFASTRITGAGAQYRGVTSGTTIVPTFSNAPAINIQAARGVTLEHFELEGLNGDHLLTGNGGDSYGGREDFDTSPTPIYTDDLTLSNWWDSGLDADGDSQYAPYAGITLDAYSANGSQSPKYPDAVYPVAWAQWNKLGISSQVTLRGVRIFGFYVGFCAYPSGGDGQGEFVQFEQCYIEYNAVGVAIPHTQARNYVLMGCNINNCYYALDNTLFGLRNGKACFQLYGCTLDRNINLFYLNAVQGGPFIMSGCYGETLYRIGDAYSGSTPSMEVIIDGCEFNFAAQWNRGCPLNIYSGIASPLVVRNCKMNAYTGVPVFNGPVTEFSGDLQMFGSYSSVARFQTGLTNTASPWMAWFNAHVGGAVLGTDNMTITNTVQRLSDVNGSTGAQSGYFTYPRTGPTAVSLAAERIYSTKAYWNDEGVGFKKGYDKLVGRTTGYTISMSGLTATITLASGLGSDTLYNLSGMNPGDCIRHTDGVSTNPHRYFIITSRTSNVITAQLIHGYSPDGVAAGTVDNSKDLYFYACRYFMPSYIHYGSFSTASATVSAVQTPVGNWLLGSEIAVGDVFAAWDYADCPTTRSGAKVDALDSGAKTITLSGVAKVTGTRRIGPLLKAQANY